MRKEAERRERREGGKGGIIHYICMAGYTEIKGYLREIYVTAEARFSIISTSRLKSTMAQRVETV